MEPPSGEEDEDVAEQAAAVATPSAGKKRKESVLAQSSTVQPEASGRVLVVRSSFS